MSATPRAKSGGTIDWAADRDLGHGRGGSSLSSPHCAVHVSELKLIVIMEDTWIEISSDMMADYTVDDELVEQAVRHHNGH
ncbi:hypothetical protein VI817_003804 [Penicillium citrinum]|nr:hypothetical protein VI817_003804 [Penicillium citrinum]